MCRKRYGLQAVPFCIGYVSVALFVCLGEEAFRYALSDDDPAISYWLLAKIYRSIVLLCESVIPAEVNEH